MKPMAFFVSQKSSFSGSILPFISLICVTRFSSEPSLSFRMLPSKGSDCFLRAAVVQDLTPNHSLSLPGREGKDDANRIKNTGRDVFPATPRAHNLFHNNELRHDPKNSSPVGQIVFDERHPQVLYFLQGVTNVVITNSCCGATAAAVIFFATG